MLRLSCFIAQQRSRSYGNLPDLKVELWPPHPDRPIEMFHTNCRLSVLRDELRALSHIPKLRIRFLESDFAKWTQDGVPRFDLSKPGETDPVHSELAKVLDHFACVTNATTVQIRLPASLARDDRNDELRWHAWDTVDTMQGGDSLTWHRAYTLVDYGMEKWHEQHFQKVTAQKARAKLDAITHDGRRKVTEAEWHELTQVWPHFETLTEWDEAGWFKGEWHYRV